MNSLNTLHRTVNGTSTLYTPKSLDGVVLEIGTEVIVPKPNATDAWAIGNFSARVVDCDEQTGDIIVLDGNDDYHVVEPDRLLVDATLDAEEVVDLEKVRDASKAADAALENEAAEAEDLKDEKNGLYPHKINVAN